MISTTRWFFLASFFPLLLIEAELGVIHDLTDGGDRVGRDLNQIQPQLFRHGVGLGGGHDALLGAVGTDQTDLFVPDLLIQLMV